MWILGGRPAATLIGDVVASRRSLNRPALHRSLTAAVARVNSVANPVSPVRITLGDEFQGVFADVPSTIGAMLLLRLELLDVTDTRYGLGWGPVQILDGAGDVQDGPGWWSGRAAIVAAADAATKRRGARVRARFSDAAEPGGTPYVDAVGSPLAGLVNLTLRTLDELFGALSDLDVRLIRGTIAGLSQTQLARAEGITQSAVSQRLARNGCWALVEAFRDTAMLDAPGSA